MVYKPSWVIWCQIHPCRRTVFVQFNTQLEWDKRFHAFLRGIWSKVNVIAGMEFVLVFSYVAIQHISHYFTGISQHHLGLYCNSMIIIIISSSSSRIKARQQHGILWTCDVQSKIRDLLIAHQTNFSIKNNLRIKCAFASLIISFSWKSY